MLDLRYAQPLLNRSCQDSVERVQAANSLVDSHMRRVAPRASYIYIKGGRHHNIFDKRSYGCDHHMCWYLQVKWGIQYTQKNSLKKKSSQKLSMSGICP